jgi:hypothetical protein
MKVAAFGKVEAFGIAPWSAHHPVEQKLRDIDQHQAGQDLVGVEPGFQKRRDRRISRMPPIMPKTASAAAPAVTASRETPPAELNRPWRR